MVLKQRLTQIEVGFVCCRGTGESKKRNERDGRREKKVGLSLLHFVLPLTLFSLQQVERWPGSLTSVPAGQMSLKLQFGLCLWL